MRLRASVVLGRGRARYGVFAAGPVRSARSTRAMVANAIDAVTAGR
ncbi:hypothetical protein JQN58_24135 [Aneurinibacillus sp. BA2021]|nr:hypothetical protein [Aneurinibacillus sp. BA2021]